MIIQASCLKCKRVIAADIDEQDLSLDFECFYGRQHIIYNKPNYNLNNRNGKSLND